MGAHSRTSHRRRISRRLRNALIVLTVFAGANAAAAAPTPRPYSAPRQTAPPPAVSVTLPPAVVTLAVTGTPTAAPSTAPARATSTPPAAAPAPPKTPPPAAKPPARTAPTPTPKPKPKPIAGLAAFLAFVRAQVGDPYQLGGTGPGAYDCSGLVQTGLATVGIHVPRTSEEQSAAAGVYVSIDDILPGDLLFKVGVGLSGHVGVYIGGGQYIAAENAALGVGIFPLSFDGFTFARRVF